MSRNPLLFVVICLAAKAGVAQDYSSYDIALKYQNDENYIMAYKHLLIFEYSNYAMLHQAANSKSLRQLEKQISEYEEFLKESVSNCSLSIKSFRGFTDGQIDSLFSRRRKPLIIQPLRLE
jgi:hypothetical protein